MILPPLTFEDFPHVFEAIHGVPPFPWQSRLAARLIAGRGWPQGLDLPTGTGKTAALDVALFHLAREADRGLARSAPVRIGFVVDRRIIVDAAAERAEIIAAALTAASGDGPVARMAARLRHLAGAGAPPLMVCALRGGLPREDDWARSPGQPTILCSTVDQVGSRLLFRGYGVSDSMKPVHAGLLGSDCLLLLDEAHLSAPFVRTLGWVHRYRRPDWCEREPGPWGVVALSATPRGPKPDFGLEEDDRSDPVLTRRLGASKPAALRALPITTRDERHRNPIAPHAEAFADAAQELLDGSGARPKLAVVVNRVALARAIFETLRTRIGKHVDLLLLTGRVREHDREALLARYQSRLMSGAGSKDGDKPIVIVATQTIEAGADFDFDGLVTQIAPLDALRQRFGRLNRMGREITARAVILAARDEVAAKADDPVYGDGSKKTWDWLYAVARRPATKGGEREVDFGLDALAPHLAGADVASLSAPQTEAPTLRPADVLLLSWTAPVPTIDPEIAPFLHGLQAGAADVQIAWRADVAREDLDGHGEHLLELLSLAPPHAREVMAVPLWAARAWLARAGAAAADTSDLEGAPALLQRDEVGRPVLRWAGTDSPRTGVVWPAAVRPGDVLVVPAAYGGCDEYGWNPESGVPVTDLGDQLSADSRKVRRRLHPALFDDAAVQERARAAIANDDRDWKEQLSQALDALGLVEAEERAGWELHRVEGYEGLVLVNRRRTAMAALKATTEEDEGVAAQVQPVALAAHTADVERHAKAFAFAAGLSPERAADVVLAAALHDLGKADARFQIFLHGGDRLAAMAADGPLAKSGDAMDRAQMATARRAAGLPERWRHEARSVACAIADPRLAMAADPELVLWLVGTHHGHGRPLYPHHDPREPVELRGPQRLDFDFGGHDWPQLYERLKARYGLWELARLEAVLRLADHRASAEAER